MGRSIIQSMVWADKSMETHSIVKGGVLLLYVVVDI